MNRLLHNHVGAFAVAVAVVVEKCDDYGRVAMVRGGGGNDDVRTTMNPSWNLLMVCKSENGTRQERDIFGVGARVYMRKW